MSWHFGIWFQCQIHRSMAKYISLLLLSSILSEFWEKVFFVIDLTKKKKYCYAWITKYWLSLIYLMSKSHVEGGSVIVQGWEIIMYYMKMSWILKINIYLLLYALTEMTWLKGKKNNNINKNSYNMKKYRSRHPRWQG